MSNSEMNPFAKTIMEQKYSHEKNGEKETWEQIAKRVSKHVMKSVGAPLALGKRVEKIIATRKFIPAGRYLYASGRPYHQTQNCYSGETEVVTEKGLSTLKELTESNNGRHRIMTSKGEWTDASFECFGEQELFEVVLTYGQAEKKLYATGGHSWRIADATSMRPNGRKHFMHKRSVSTVELLPGDTLWQVFGYGISRTPVSPIGIMHGLVWGDGSMSTSKHESTIRLCGEKNKELQRYFKLFPCRSIENDIEVTCLPSHFKSLVPLDHDRSYLLGWLAGYFAADGCVSKTGTVTLASHDKKSLSHVKDVCYLLGIGCNQIQAGTKVSNLDNREYEHYSVSLDRSTLTEDFFLISEHKKRWLSNPLQRQTYWKVKSVNATSRTEPVYCAVVPKTHEFTLADNILTGNCLLLKAEDSREGWAELAQKATMALMTGAGIGIVYSDLRAEGSKIRKTGGTATGPLALMQMVNELGRGIMQGGSRRSAIWAGLHWNHPDVFKFIRIKDWSPEVRKMKEQDYNFPATLDGTNISVILDDLFFTAYKNDKHKLHSQAHAVYWEVVHQMAKTAEPGFSVDVGDNAGEHNRNACCEITSKDDSDICNLGSINMAEIESLEDMKEVVELATAFLLAGTVYSDVPYPRVDQVRTKNRRLGLGLMGLHEWLLKNNYSYGANEELDKYLDLYKESTEIAAKYASEWELSPPVKTRAVAPTGTIGIVAETTTGIEPIFCVAYKRRYLKGNVVNYQYVIDPTANKLIEKGLKPEQIEDAYTLAENVERRVAFQAHIQSYVDHAISSTINLPAWGSELNNENTVQDFGNMLIQYLPKLRGITCYPDGARGGQPLTPVKYNTAIKHIGEVFIEQADICDITKGGSCGV